MRYCSTCGTLNDTDAKFCSGCGKQFANAPDKPVEVYAAPETYEEPENFTQPEYNSEDSFYTNFSSDNNENNNDRDFF